MSEADEFRQYAEEALRWAEQSKTAREKKALIELARTWTQAAVQVESTFVSRDKRRDAHWTVSQIENDPT